MATLTALKVFSNEITASEQDGTYLYLGTDGGDVIRYTIATGVVTVLKNVGGKIISMNIYAGVLYIGIAGGKLASLTTT